MLVHLVWDYSWTKKGSNAWLLEVGENAEFEKQYLNGKLEVKLQGYAEIIHKRGAGKLLFCYSYIN